MPGGIYLVAPKDYHQRQANRNQDAIVNLAEKIIQKRRGGICNGDSAKSEDKKPLRTDSAVQIQEISGIIPPSRAAMGDFQIIGCKVFDASAENHGSQKFPQRFIPKPL